MKVRIFRSGKLLCESEGKLNETLLNHIIAEGFFIDAPCGGMGHCEKCLVGLHDGKKTLACCTPITGDIDVFLPEEAKIITYINKPVSLIKTTSESEKLGVAFDIGTTTIAAYLIDITTGGRICAMSDTNAQRAYGADVISRINHCAENGHGALTQIVRQQIQSLIIELCETSGRQVSDIVDLSVAGNTIMSHLVADYSPVSMGVMPFTPLCLFGRGYEISGWDDLLNVQSIYIAPAISAYVGGDITAGMLASDFVNMPNPSIYLDIGTNGEIVLKYGEKYYCCATAAGPAFEGAEIQMGMAAINGAISHVKWDNGLKITVVGKEKPIGLCGSGLVDALAMLLETGAVDETGQLLNSDEIEHEIAKYISVVDNQNVFFVSPDNGVYISAKDIRMLQLAKAAIMAGIKTLLHHANITEVDVKSFVLAGGFGSFMDKANAARIGIFPQNFIPIAKTVGNAAGDGAVLALHSKEARDSLNEIQKKCEEIELALSTKFNEQFIEQMTFKL